MTLSLNLEDTENRSNSAISRRGIGKRLSNTCYSVENPFSVIQLGVIFVPFGKGLEFAVRILFWGFFLLFQLFYSVRFLFSFSVYFIVNWSLICGYISLLGFGLIKIVLRAWNLWK